MMKVHQKKIVSDISDFIKKTGVKDYVLIFNDPDSFDVLSSYNGVLSWIVGALRLKQIEIENSWLEQNYKHESEVP